VELSIGAVNVTSLLLLLNAIQLPLLTVRLPIQSDEALNQCLKPQKKSNK